MKGRTFGIVLVVAACGVLALASTSQAATITQIIQGNSGGQLNTASDDSVEVIIDRNSNGTLDVGDSLRGIFRILTLEPGLPGDGGSTILGGGTSNNEWTGIFQTEVVRKVDNGDGTYGFYFGPDSTFSEANTLLGAGSGAMALFYEQGPTHDYSTTGGPFSSDITHATNGDFFWALGFNGTVGANGLTNLDEGWFSEETLDSIPGGVVPVGIGLANFALNRVGAVAGNGTGISITLQPSIFGSNQGVEFSGSSEFQSVPGGNWPISDELELNFIAFVPVPGAAWMGLALLGGLLGVRIRRRRSNPTI